MRRIQLQILPWVLCSIVLAGGIDVAHAQVELVASAAIAGDTPDSTAAKGELLGGFSGMAYAGEGDRYLLISDRGPGDGDSSYRCRLHSMEIRVQKQSKTLATRLLSTTLMQDDSGESFVGSLAALGKSRSGTALRLDPEAICISKRGTYFISDEYGPCVHEFDQQGRRLRSLTIPAELLMADASASSKEKLVTYGRGALPNAGLEGLAISPDRTRLFALLQAPLAQDGGRSGVHVRLVELGVDAPRTRQFVYVLDAPKLGLSELLAINSHQFLVIERDGKPGPAARVKRIYKIDIRGASDVSAQDSLGTTSLPPGIIPVQKTLLLDLLDRRYSIAGADCPAKVEGLCFGPDLPDGRRLLLVASDNDFLPEQPSRVYAFAVSQAEFR
ncbi:MAG: esterase-like activity of phytase family protein [Planctomycetes bacterium]|nr:esterase-like activity of phytase family protein [Planctomycetota bacterium]